MSDEIGEMLSSHSLSDTVDNLYNKVVTFTKKPQESPRTLVVGVCQELRKIKVSPDGKVEVHVWEKVYIDSVNMPIRVIDDGSVYNDVSMGYPEIRSKRWPLPCIQQLYSNPIEHIRELIKKII